MAGIEDQGADATAVGVLGEVAGAEVIFVKREQGGEVLADEAQVGGARTGFEEERLGGEEAGVCGGGAGSHAVDGGGGVGDSGEQRRAEDSGGETSLAELADGIEAKIGAGRAGFEQAGELGVGRGDGEVQDEGVALGDPGEEIDVAQDEGGLGDDAEAVTGAAGEDFEQGAGDAGAAFDRLVGICGGAEGDLFDGIDLAELLFEQPGGVLLEVDGVFERGSPGLGLGGIG